MKTKPLFPFIFQFSTATALFANNMQISAVTYSQAGNTVQFNIAWENAWNSSSTWDAAWVFVKFRDCATSDPFTHGLLSTVLADHTFGAVLQPIKSDGSSVAIDAAADNTGVMLRKITLGSGNIVAQTITLKLTNLPASGTLDVRVFATEMVFIPQGNFDLGDEDGTAKSYGGFQDGTPSCAAPYTVTSEAATVLSDIDYDGASITTGCGSNALALTASFPKGYNAFHIMKYEITQGQYADFLNTVQNALNRFPGQNGVNRHTISNTGAAPTTYVASRPNRACNFLSWADFSSFLDWSALRPLTEFQYEKAARGGNFPIAGELAWGNTTRTGAAAGGISGAEDGTETITTAGANLCAGNVTFTSGDAGAGPLRVGIFATSATTTRTQTGGSAYGVMELSGNVEEYYVGFLAGSAGQISAGGISRGDGSVDANALHNVANWPVAPTPGSINDVIRRGGSWNTSFATLLTAAGNCYVSISYRGNSAIGYGSCSTCVRNLLGRDAYSGGRGGR